MLFTIKAASSHTIDTLLVHVVLLTFNLSMRKMAFIKKHFNWILSRPRLVPLSLCYGKDYDPCPMMTGCSIRGPVPLLLFSVVWLVCCWDHTLTLSGNRPTHARGCARAISFPETAILLVSSWPKSRTLWGRDCIQGRYKKMVLTFHRLFVKYIVFTHWNNCAQFCRRRTWFPPHSFLHRETTRRQRIVCIAKVKKHLYIHTYFVFLLFSLVLLFSFWISFSLVSLVDFTFWQSTANISLKRENGAKFSRSRNISEMTSPTLSFVKLPSNVLNRRFFGFANSNTGRLSGKMPKTSPYSGWQDALTQR